MPSILLNLIIANTRQIPSRLWYWTVLYSTANLYKEVGIVLLLMNSYVELYLLLHMQYAVVILDWRHMFSIIDTVLYHIPFNAYGIITTSKFIASKPNSRTSKFWGTINSIPFTTSVHYFLFWFCDTRIFIRLMLPTWCILRDT